MIGPRNVHPDELGDAEGMEIQDAIRVGNRLIEGIDDLSIGSTEDFADRVMAALSDEPTPGTTGFLAPLRGRAFPAGLIASVRQAWASARTERPMLGRSAALAYVLAVAVAAVSLTGVVTLGAAGALGLFDPTSTPSPSPNVAQPTPAPTGPELTIAPSSPEVSQPPVGPTPSPTETENEPDGSDDHGGNSGPGGDGSDNSGPGGGDDDSGSGGKSGSGGNSGPGSSGSGSDDSGSGSSASGSGSSGSGSGGSDDSGRR